MTKNGYLHLRYLYANGRPLRVDLMDAAGQPPAYFRYNARGDAAGFVDQNGSGGAGWTQYGAWGNQNYGSDFYYSWNAAWGYMIFPAGMGFNMHDVYDIGLYYAHGRWYNQDTGLWLSPNERGDYIYFDDDPVNKHANPRQATINGAPNNACYHVPHDDRDLTCWMVAELQADVNSPEANSIKYLLNERTLPCEGAACSVLREIDFATRRLMAYEKWIPLVRDRAKWDFKHEILVTMGDTIQLCHTECEWLDYSTPGNIGFGYVGTAVGFSWPELHGGAGKAEAEDPAHLDERNLGDYYINREWWRSLFDDPQDAAAIEFGIDLYERFGTNITLDNFRTVLASYIGRMARREAPNTQYSNPRWPYKAGEFNMVEIGLPRS